MLAPLGRFIVGSFWRFNINYRSSGGYLIEQKYSQGIENEFSVTHVQNIRSAEIAVIDLQFDFVGYPDKISLEVRSDSSKYLSKDVKELIDEYLIHLKGL